jgi:predicted nucleic acid-binding protein
MTMNKIYVLDSFAWVEYVLGSPMGSFVEYLLKIPDVELITPSIVIAELSFKFQLEQNPKWDMLRKFIKIKTKSIDLTYEMAEKSGTQKLQLRKTIKGIGLADAIIYQTSIEMSAKLVTGDPHFEMIKDVVYLARPEDIEKEKDILKVSLIR